MKNHHTFSVVLLLGAVGCSVKSESNTRQENTQVSSAIASAPSTDSSSNAQPGVMFSAGQAPARQKNGNGPASVAVTAPATAEQLRPTPKQATAAQAAAASLEALANVVAADPSTKRGFASPQEVSSSTLADGLPVYFLGLDRLTAFTPDQDTRTLALDKQQVVYPIVAADGARSSVTVQKGSDGTWEPVKFGDAPLARNVYTFRQDVAAKRSVDAGFSLIEAPALQVYLLSHGEKGIHMVTPLWDIPGTSYTAGVPKRAADVFAALQPIAAKTDRGGPPSQP